MSATASSSSSTCRSVWNQEMENVLIRLLVNEIRKGKRSANSFKSESWKTMTVRFNEECNVRFENPQLKTKYNQVNRSMITIILLCPLNEV